ncbi:hypothetical protein BKM31_42415 [[Actinomadura] parvosata subsp. kistnae]|uniref:Uncharacterized protein n=1 Tax=[Actinomadura] parvosata subsp. kistnae TaxID=1909395 RepID=A0A1V0AAM2_9ACTN|nr:hypothetical protein [Nonomuraea sp. ATCC 55076]AQZ67229.1 hypothetical protein BKM31_42415 [Nonomuraea sp. ATCC 55076]
MHSEEQAKQLIDELTGHIYTALRDGGLDAEPVLELACSLEEWGVSTPATQELLERPAARLPPADLTRLGESLLRDTGFEPTFALEPRMWDVLEQALKVVERDVRAAEITGTLRLITHDRDDNGHAWVEFQGGYWSNHGTSIPPIAGGDVQGALACVADATQEVIMELTWKVWPVCATHDRGLRAELVHGIAVWRCTGDGTHTVAPIGELS